MNDHFTLSKKVWVGSPSRMEFRWLRASGDHIDEHAAFRISFTTSAVVTTVEVQHCGISWYNVYVDGVRMAEGPTRFVGSTPYFDQFSAADLKAGTHVIAVHGHSVGEQTRILLKNPPFVGILIQSTDPDHAPISTPVWRCAALAAYKSQWRRLSTLLGWCECVNVDTEQQTWQQPGFDDSQWASPVTAASTLSSNFTCNRNLLWHEAAW